MEKRRRISKARAKAEVQGLPRLYGELAWLWPIVTPPGDYAAEAAIIRAAIKQKLGRRARGHRPRLLELGTGGGHVLSHLKGDFECTAVDASAEMLKQARKLNPEVRHVRGDMRKVRLGEIFDAVVIHDAIDYMLTEEELASALGTAGAHLGAGGVVVVCPSYVRETFEDHQVEHDAHEGGGLHVTYVCYEHDPDPKDTTVELVLVFFICEGGKLRVEQDRHVTGLFGVDRWLGAMGEAGFEAEARPVTLRGRQKRLRDQTPVFIGTFTGRTRGG